MLFTHFGVSGPLIISASSYVGKKFMDKNGQKKELTLHGDSVLLGDSVIHNYRFCENYYFVSGDKMVNSKDSRYWGLLPEPFIVGRAWLVWKSVSPNTGKMRWKRIFKRID